MTSDERQIRDLQASWFEATRRGDAPALRALMTDDVVFLAPGQQPFGAAAFLAAFEAGRARMRVEPEGELEEVVVAGDLAFARTRLSVRLTPLPDGAPKRLAGFTLSVYRRDPDGRWRLARDANLLAPEAP